MELPLPDPAVLLAAWMEWEKGDALPGKVLADLKRAGMRQLLDTLAAAAQTAAQTVASPQPE
jgi:hypothetical protein